VVLSFVVPIMIIVLLVKYVGAGDRGGRGQPALTAEATEARIQPVARFELKGAGGAKALRAGGRRSTRPSARPAMRWVPRARPSSAMPRRWLPDRRDGYDALLNSALKGKGAMRCPRRWRRLRGHRDRPRAGRHRQLAAGGNLAEPKAPAPAEDAKKEAPQPAPGACPAGPAAPAGQPAASGYRPDRLAAAVLACSRISAMNARGLAPHRIAPAPSVRAPAQREAAPRAGHRHVHQAALLLDAGAPGRVGVCRSAAGSSPPSPPWWRQDALLAADHEHMAEL
jgi:hypothetical protein